MFTFDWTISVQNLIAFGGIVFTCLVAFQNLKSEVRIVKHDQKATDFKINVMTESMQQLTSILTRVAVQDERFNGFEHRIETCEADVRDLQNGVGFKTEKLAGEYLRTGRINKV